MLISSQDSSDDTRSRVKGSGVSVSRSRIRATTTLDRKRVDGDGVSLTRSRIRALEMKAQELEKQSAALEPKALELEETEE